MCLQAKMDSAEHHACSVFVCFFVYADKPLLMMRFAINGF